MQRVTLQHNVQVDGNVNSGTDVMLHDNVIIRGDIDCGRTVILSDGATVRGKVIGRYGVQFTTLAMGAAAALISSNTRREVIVGGNVGSESSNLDE